MSIKNNKNICLVYIYMEILGDKKLHYYICMCFTAETIITLREFSIVFQYVLLLYAV